MEFELDTGAMYSVLKKPLGSLSKKQTLIQGANESCYRPWTTKRTMDLGKGKIQHSFLVIPNCPSPLLGRDLLTKLRAQITFEDTGSEIAFVNPMVQPLESRVSVLTIQAEEYQLYAPPAPTINDQEMEPWLLKIPEAWAETAGLGASHITAPGSSGIKGHCLPYSDTPIPDEQGSEGRHKAPYPEVASTGRPSQMPVCLEYSIAASQETRHRGIQASTRPKGCQQLHRRHTSHCA